MRNLTAGAAAAAAVIAVSACGPTTKLQLDLRSVSVTVPRLLAPAVQLVPPAPVPASLPPVAPVATLLPPVTPVPPVPTPAPACPQPSELAVPAKAATLTIDAPPAAGTTYELAEVAYTGAKMTPSKGSTVGLVKVTVQHLPTTTNLFKQEIDSWSVQQTNAADHTTTVEVYELVHPSTNAAATASGVYLVGLAWTDPVRGTLSFQPEGNGIEVMPNPVSLSTSTGVQYVGVATDPHSLTTLALIRNVTGRKRIAACGQVIDSFTDQMEGVLTTANDQWTLTWAQQYATAYGAADVQEAFQIASVTPGLTWTEVLEVTAVPKPTS